MKKVLIISPHFPPVNAPDMQRVRLALPHLREHGWEPVVLAVDPALIEGGVIDPKLEETYPSDIRIIRTGGTSPNITRRVGIGNLWLRCGRALKRAGTKLLSEEKFDLVFFSTTQFSFFQLAPLWKKTFGVPYVLDYQDPWVNRYYERTGTAPPGGVLKFALSQFVARRIEPEALREAAGVIAVSDSYGSELASSYKWFDPASVRVLPFGASAADFEALGDYRPQKPLVDFNDGCIHHLYVGRCGPDMTFAMTALFRAFKLALQTHEEAARLIRFHFIGTDYAPPPMGREWAVPIARAEGIASYVTEHRYRVPYFDALYYLRNADALMALGSNDPTYSASKIFPYLLAGRPLLLIFHERSLVNEFVRNVGAGQRFTFTSTPNVDFIALNVYRKWFIEGSHRAASPVNKAAFSTYTSAFLTSQLAAVFDAAASKGQS